MPNKIDPMAAELLELASNGMTADKIVKELKKRYPDAKRKDVMRMAFQLVVDIASSKPEAALQLQALALDNSGPD